ncbi:hypothetical protein GALL_126580 [mine drainage metagenome]|uniref:TIR domain-containing protein n=1 Tax=mine drainage metagenome TaxID=410659 RepID=A0A1J5SU05_9ZZZZ
MQLILDFLWSEWTTTTKWPKCRLVQAKFGKSLIKDIELNLNDAYMLQCEPSHDPTYELRLFGAVSTSSGEQLLRLLAGFTEFLTAAFNVNPGREESFKSDEIAKFLKLSPDETADLGRILSFHVFDMMNMGHAKSYEWWECGIPGGFADIAEPGDPVQKLERVLVHRYQPRYPVNIDDRNAVLAQMPQPAFREPVLGILGLGREEDQDGPVSLQASPEVFVSHSAKDMDMADALLQLLTAALGLKRGKIRCTSVDGSKLPLAADTDEQLRSEIRDCRIFLALLTPASLQSTYVLFELGARWGGESYLAGLFARGASGATLKGPMSRLNVLNAHNEADLHSFVGDLAKKMQLPSPKPGEYLRELKQLCVLSRAGDPLVQYEGKRVKARGQQNREQYFVYKGYTHYLEPDAAQVCESARIPYTPVEPEDLAVLCGKLDDSLGTLQMKAILKELGLLGER